MLTADLMVGFPGETDEDFLDTMRFVREAGLLDAHVFAYSKREGTPAADYPDQIDERVKHERSATLIKECSEVRESVLSNVVALGEPLRVIFETKKGGLYYGHSDSYIEVYAEGEGKCGDVAFVQPERTENGAIYGKIIKQDN